MKFTHPMPKAKTYTGQKVMYVQKKLDGHRLLFLKQATASEKQAIALMRNNTDLYEQLYEKAKGNNIWPWLAKLLALPPNSSVDGELHVPGEPASYIKTAIKDSDDRLQFTAFALPYLDGRQITDFAEAFHITEALGIDFAPFYYFEEPKILNVDYWEQQMVEDQEGWVAKLHHYSGWYKIKKVRTLDAIITRIVPGEGKYFGLIGALGCSIFNSKGEKIEICSCSGMTDDIRHQTDLVGKVVEIKYQEVGSKGRLRHPNFLRFREDKLPYECTTIQDPRLLEVWECSLSDAE
jgi:ATP-dependent DNA ligase